jgi:hypothetical protein
MPDHDRSLSLQRAHSGAQLPGLADGLDGRRKLSAFTKPTVHRSALIRFTSSPPEAAEALWRAGVLGAALCGPSREAPQWTLGESSRLARKLLGRNVLDTGGRVGSSLSRRFVAVCLDRIAEHRAERCCG